MNRGLVVVVARRLVLGLASLLVVSALIFWAVELLPGDAATRTLGQHASEELLAQRRAEMQLDDPALVRYGRWVSDLATGDWGVSLTGGRPVMDLVLPRLQNTLFLAGLTLSVYVVGTLATGLIVTRNPHGRVSDLLASVSLTATAVPEFVTGVALLTLFAVMIPVFPPLAMADRAGSTLEAAYVSGLPAITLAIPMVGYAARTLQSSLTQVLRSDFVLFSAFKGIPPRRVFLRHALPSAMGPVLRVTIINIGWLVSSAVVVEVIFNYPGIGRLLVESVRLLNTPVISATAIILASLYLVMNLLADLVAVWLNPRLRAAR